MTVRSEEEFSPKHSGIQTDTQATVIAAHPEFSSRGGWGTSENVFQSYISWVDITSASS